MDKLHVLPETGSHGCSLLFVDVGESDKVVFSQEVLDDR